MAGQVVKEGFLDLRMVPWLRRLVTRLVALGPAVVVIAISGSEGIYELLVLSQVVLSLQLPFAIVPLVHFTADARKMGAFANPRWVTAAAWLVAAVVIALNASLVWGKVAEWLEGGAVWPWFAVVPVAAALAGLLAYMIVMPMVRPKGAWDPGAATDGRRVAARIPPMKIRRIGAALERAPGDARILSAAVALAKSERARLILIHVVDTPGTLLMGSQSASRHATQDESYLEELVRELEERELPVESLLRFGRPTEGIVAAVEEAGIDLLVMGSHGHGRVEGLLYGETVARVHHRIRVPLLVVPTREDTPLPDPA
ncbi:MAG TPA: universal stress protein [Desulfobacterales bacterium]|nr:universal stress protein [Desulfobacterales bacterium]